MALTTDDWQFLKTLYQRLDDRPLQPGDALYERIYEHPGCDDPVAALERRIKFADTESVSLFSGFSGSGKTTELFRLRERLENTGITVLYADARDYINTASPLPIADLLVVLAGAFSDALEAQGIAISAEGYWARLRNWLANTEVGVKELGLKAGTEGGGADLKLEFRSTPSFRQRLSSHLSGRIGELYDEVAHFFEDGVKAVRAERGDGTKVVFLFDSLEQLQGSLYNAQEVTRSVILLFSAHLKLLEIPYVHVVYTVPPWLKFVYPGVNTIVLPCLRLWNNDPERSECGPGIAALRSLVTRRLTSAGLNRCFGADPFSRVNQLILLSGGHFGDLLLLLREVVLRAEDLPVPDGVIERAIIRVRSNFLPISLQDAKWLFDIDRELATLLQTNDPDEVNRLTRFLNTHVVLYLKNGTEWYDVHPLVRDEVSEIVTRAAAAETT